MAKPPSPLQKALKPVRGALGEPRLTGPLLLAVLFYRLQQKTFLSRISWLTSTAAVRTLGFFFGLSIIKLINRKLSQWQLNNYRKDATFVKSQELVLITGGVSGIGLLMAQDFKRRGVRVIVIDKNEPDQKLASGITYFKCDVTSTSEVAAVGKEIRATLGNPTVLINNAGIATCATILEAPEEWIRATFEVNTIAHYWLVREFLPAMIKSNHGHVVTISSMASFVVHAQNVDYCCTKASSLAFHEGLASELKSRYDAPDVKTTIVHPTWIKTPLIARAIGRPEFTEVMLEPEGVAKTIVDQVVSGRSAQLLIPEAMGVLATLRSWPSWMQERVRNKIAPQLSFIKHDDLSTK